jgi:hypothetical protein
MGWSVDIVESASARGIVAVHYRSVGFVEVGPYSDNPTPGEIYLRLSL